MSSVEAAQAAALLCGQFPNVGKGDEIFLRSLAALLAGYARSVVEDCLSPRTGLAPTIDFISLHAVRTWCDARGEQFTAVHSRQARIEQQLAERRPEPPPIGSYSYKQFLEWAKANGKPPRPIGRFETAPPR